MIFSKANTPQIAVIDESTCIGCTKCIKACPFDAIIGTNKHMHVVLPQDCTGCGLCVDPCPVDCITLIPIKKPMYKKERAENQLIRKELRTLQEQQAKAALYQQKRSITSLAKQSEKEAKKNYILAALKRVEQKKHE
ncbi:MAG: hypothetical protein A3F18_02955 [Legionellales bacterium RIFCSPHIGHO2_12_FULL_37_14]|nr:MAG: hypothetical protein A3F18_02955 [Legionellales bacterium RIFCSPHIGHO2_12_FULL_37_14]